MLRQAAAACVQPRLRAALLPSATRAYHKNVRAPPPRGAPPRRQQTSPAGPAHAHPFSRTAAARPRRFSAPRADARVHARAPRGARASQVVDHYEKPRNVGSFDKKDPNVGTGLVGAPACGDVMKLQIRVRARRTPCLAAGAPRARAAPRTSRAARACGTGARACH
jgi:hypothetical protein